MSQIPHFLLNQKTKLYPFGGITNMGPTILNVLRTPLEQGAEYPFMIENKMGKISGKIELKIGKKSGK